MSAPAVALFDLQPQAYAERFAGWYWYLTPQTEHPMEPRGPYPTEEAALDAARKTVQS